MSKSLAVLIAFGFVSVFSVRSNADESPVPFDQGVDIRPALERAENNSTVPKAEKSVPALEDPTGMIWVTMENADAQVIRKKIDLARRQTVAQPHSLTIFPVTPEELPRLTQIMHERRNRCGGFFAYDSMEEAIADGASVSKPAGAKVYSISRKTAVESLLGEVREDRIRDTISQLAAFNNRYYKSATGVASSKWIEDTWTGIARGRADIKIETFAHSWPQSSIIATITGSKEPEKVIVLGGHQDSIGGMWGGESARAPGADDDASGIAVITEALRIIVEKGFRPERTVQIMAYAAEEVGLRGSRDISTAYKNQGVDVQAVVQFDMTSFKGASEGIYLITDFTNASLNGYLGRLIDTYVKVPWSTTQCGYGCSDHASWTRNGFPASFPFEATKDGANSSIHSARDTLETIGGDAKHSVPFAKLAVSFIVETSKAGAVRAAAPRP